MKLQIAMPGATAHDYRWVNGEPPGGKRGRHASSDGGGGGEEGACEKCNSLADALKQLKARWVEYLDDAEAERR